MANPYVRNLGGVDDMDGVRAAVGFDYDTVTVGTPSRALWRFNRAQTLEFARLLLAACWEAGGNARQMAEEEAQ